MRGGASAAIAAENAGIASMASSVCSPSIEDIAAAANNPKFYQLYVRGDDAWVDEVLARVTASGYLGLCLTVDTAVVSRRERDIAKRVIPTSQAAGTGILRSRPSSPGRILNESSKNRRSRSF